MASTSEIGRFHSDKGTEGTVTMKLRPDGDWTFTWWCPMPTVPSDPEVAHGNGVAKSIEDAIERSRIEANAQAR